MGELSNTDYYYLIKRQYIQNYPTPYLFIFDIIKVYDYYVISLKYTPLFTFKKVSVLLLDVLKYKQISQNEAVEFFNNIKLKISNFEKSDISTIDKTIDVLINWLIDGYNIIYNGDKNYF